MSPRTSTSATAARLIDALTRLLPFIGCTRTLNGLRAVDEAAPRPKEKETP